MIRRTLIRALKEALDYGLILEKIHKVIKFNQETWLRTNISKTGELRTKAKNDFEKDFFKLMSHSVFQKTMKNLRRHSGIRFVTIVV